MKKQEATKAIATTDCRECALAHCGEPNDFSNRCTTCPGYNAYFARESSLLMGGPLKLATVAGRVTKICMN